MGLIGLMVIGAVGLVVIIVILIVIMSIASYTLAQINNTEDEPDYGCKWDDSESLKSLHVKLSWTISLSVIGLVLTILGIIGLVILGVVFSEVLIPVAIATA
jgi:hypothetical protein